MYVDTVPFITMMSCVYELIHHPADSDTSYLGQAVLQGVHFECKYFLVLRGHEGGELMQWFLHPTTKGDGHAEQLRVVCKVFLKKEEKRY